MRRAGVIAMVAVAVASGAPAAVLPPGEPACDAEMPAYTRSPLRSASGTRLALDPPGDGALLYLGVRHTANPADAQLGAIEREMRGFRPTLVLYEGDSRAVGNDRRETVKRYGESGFVRFLAAELGVATRSFDATAGAVVSFLGGRFEPEEVKLFFVLREIWLLRERQGKSDAEVREIAGRIIRGELLPGLPRVLTTEDEFARAFARRWPPGVRWWRPRAEWFDPYRDGRSSGGGFTNRLEQAVTVYRDVTMYRTAARAVAEGERVFAVAGGGHLPMQEPALRCALGSR